MQIEYWFLLLEEISESLEKDEPLQQLRIPQWEYSQSIIENSSHEKETIGSRVIILDI